MFDANAYIKRHNGATRLGHTPRIECADGFSMSVQVGRYLYSHPRQDVAFPYTAVEVGFPSSREDALMPYIDGDDSDPTETVYGYVPVEIVNAIVDAHGGAKE